MLVPEQNDSDKEVKNIANFIADELGKEVPWHVSAFHPAYKMLEVQSTEPSKIERAIGFGKQMGLKYVYAGNLAENRRESTHCSRCQELVIERVGHIVRRFDRKGSCPRCKTKIDLILE